MLFYPKSRPGGLRLLRLISLATMLVLVSGCASYQPEQADMDVIFSAHQHRAEKEPLWDDANLADLIGYAQQHHPRIQAARAELDRARANMTVAGAWMDPELNVSQGITDSSYRTLGVSQDIPIFQRRAMAIAQARAEYKASQIRLYQVQADLEADVVEALSEFLYVKEAQSLQQELMALLEHVLRVVEQQYAAGNGAMSELLRAQNALDSANSDFANLQALMRAQQARLNSALGRNAQAELAITLNLLQAHQSFAHLPEAPDHLYGLVDERNATLLANRYAVEASYVSRDRANRTGLPRLMVGVEYMDTDMGSGTLAGMMSLSLPIWRANYKAQLEGAQAEVQAAEAQLRTTRLNIQAQLSMALYQWQEAERNRELYGEVLVRRAEQAVASTLSQYSNGDANFSDVVASQQEWLSFALAYRRALANQLSAVATVRSLILPAADTEVSL